MVEEARRGDGDLEMAFERSGKRRRLALDRQRRVARHLGSIEQRRDQRGVVSRRNTQRIAGFVDQPRSGDVELDVAGFLGRVTPDDQAIFDDPGGKRIALVVERRRGEGRGDGCDCASTFGVALEQGERRGAPFGRRLFVIHVAVDARREPGRAKLFEVAVEALSRLAIMFVGRVSKRENGEAQRPQLWRLGPLDIVEQIKRGLRRIAFAVGADDHQQVLFVLQPARLVACHVDHARRDATCGRQFAKRIGQAGAVAGLAAVEDGQRPAVRREHDRIGAPSNDPGSGQPGVKPSEIATDPARLLGRDRAGQRVDLRALLQRQCVGWKYFARRHRRNAPGVR